MQGPKEPPEKKEPAKKTESQVEDPWEDEVQDQLGNKIDDVLDQIRKEPLPQPTPSKRRKTKGKKKFDRKVLSSESMGLSEQLSEIKINVMETREALYNMYKIDKARFEFKKSIDKKLTTRLAARKREKELEQIKPDPGDSNTSAVGEGEKEDSALAGLLDFLLGPFKKAGVAGLSAALAALGLPLILDAVEDYLTKDTKGPRNQVWDPLGIIPDPREGEQDDPVTKFFNWFIPKAEDSAEPSVRDGSRTPEGEAEAFSSFWGDIFRSREESNEPSVRDGSRTPQTGFDFVPSQDSKGKKYGKAPLSIPVRRAFDGGKFTKGVKKPLKPIVDIPPVGSGVQKLTEPLRSSITVPQKVATLGILNLANSILQPFNTILPDDANSEIKSLFTGIMTRSGLGNFNLKTKSQNVFEKIKKFIDNILNSLLGGSAQAAQSQTPTIPGADYYGPGGGPGGGRTSMSMDAADIEADTPEEKAFIATVRELEGTAGEGGYNTWFGGRTDMDMTKMSIQEVHDEQTRRMAAGETTYNGLSSAAVGAGQFMTPLEQARSMYASQDREFDPTKVMFDENFQNELILDLAKRKRGVDVSKRLTEGDMRTLGGEWASFTPQYGQTSRTASESLSAYNENLGEAQKVTPKVSGLTPTSEDMSWYNDMMKPSTPIDKSPPEPDPKRQFNPMEAMKNLIGVTPTVASSPSQKVKKPKTTTPIGSQPMLQPGGY